MLLKQIFLATQVVDPTGNQLSRHMYCSSQQWMDICPSYLGLPAPGKEMSGRDAQAAGVVTGEM